MKTPNNKTLRRHTGLKKVLSLFLFITIATSFVSSSPDPIVKNKLVQIAIEQINEADAKYLSTKVAEAQSYDSGADDQSNNSTDGSNQSSDDYDDDDEGTHPVCCDPVANNDASGAVMSGNSDVNGDPFVCGDSQSLCSYDDDDSKTPICCDTYRGGRAPGPTEECGDADTYCGPRGNHPVCCDRDALNDQTGPATSGNFDQNGNLYVCGDSASLCVYDDTDKNPPKTKICCDVNKGGRAPGPNEECGDPATYCTKTPGKATYCCDGNWNNYTPPSDRVPDYECDYDGPPNGMCSCTLTDPFQDPWGGSQCGGNNNGDLPGCSASVSFSVIKSGVEIAGTATMSHPFPIDELGNLIVGYTCPDSELDKAFLAGRAAADATPSTPLNTPITLDAFSSYIVTSKDYCLNVAGVQSTATEYDRNDAGFCCENPTVIDPLTENSCVSNAPENCGTANGSGPLTSAPTTNLCTSGTPSDVSASDTEYSWTCNTGGSSGSCSASREIACTNLDCGADDVCKNVSGEQTSSSLSGANLSVYGSGECYNTTSGVCGSQTYAPYTTTNLTPSSPNLCASGSSLYSDPAYNSGTNMWNWTCETTNGGEIAPPTCSVAKCVGSQCQTQQSSGLIKTFKAQPLIVAAPTDTCNITWTSSVDSSISDPVQGCRLNDKSIDDNNPSGILVSPGPYTLMCFIGDQFETRSIKCSVKPDYKEI